MYEFVAYLDNQEEELKNLHDAIVECYLEDQKWKFLKVRTDKDTANHYKVYQNILRSIEESVSEQELLDVCLEIKKEWKSRE